ncbi:MAG: hypothetical protein NTZ83_02190, partial [Candidatus Pacearchaeota archaeon]|nr:hypothetical protein [Candidatus Pacearchaeota archaeon]
KDAGFSYARTVKEITTKYPKDLFQANTSIHAFPLSIRGVAGEIKYALRGEIELIPNLFTKDWEVMAKRIFDYVLKNGGTFHLWGHSWEVEKHNEWDKLERVLAYISNKQDVKYLINSKIIGGLRK